MDGSGPVLFASFAHHFQRRTRHKHFVLIRTSGVEYHINAQGLLTFIHKTKNLDTVAQGDARRFLQF